LTTIPKTPLVHAGFYLAHAAWVQSDLPLGELYCPTVLTITGQDKQISPSEADTQLEALENARDFVRKNKAIVDYWCLAWEGFLNINNNRTDVINIEFGYKRQMLPMRVVQPFHKSTQDSNFQLIGRPLLIVGNECQDGESDECYIRWVLEGVHSHSAASPLWDSWLVTMQ
jgi:hypothetical protein